MGALLFGPAGTTRYWQAWVYIAIYVAASIPTMRYLVRKDPELLERRMRGGPMFGEGTHSAARHDVHVTWLYRAARRARARPTLRVVQGSGLGRRFGVTSSWRWA